MQCYYSIPLYVGMSAFLSGVFFISFLDLAGGDRMRWIGECSFVYDVRYLRAGLELKFSHVNMILSIG